jgi:hypothetical protein
MTCSHCHTNFSYKTGQKTIAGNHSDASVTLQYNTLPSQLFAAKYHTHPEIISYLRVIEDNAPPNPVNKISSHPKLESIVRKVQFPQKLLLTTY